MKVQESQLKEIFSKLFHVDVTEINDESSMDTIEEWDSLKHLKLVLALEDECNVSFTEEESVEILSYALIKEVLKEHGIEVIA